MVLRAVFLLGTVACVAFGFTAAAEESQIKTIRVPHAAPETAGIDPGSLDRIDVLVEEAIKEKKCPGAVVMIGHRGKVIFHRAYGHRTLKPQPEPMLKDTVFDLASLTKPIATATSVMHLVETGAVALDDPAAKHLPEFGVSGKDEVTIRQLLLHVGGLIPDNSLADYRDGPEKSRENFLKLKLSYPPGTDFRYSDVGFQVLGELIHAKTGKTVAEYAEEIVFAPLGMRETGFLPDEPLRQRAAVTQQREDRWMQGEVHDPRAYAMGGVAGHAGLFSTADDLAVYAQMMLGGGSYRDVTVLGPDTVRTMTDAYEVPGGKDGKPRFRGLGWDKRSPYSSNRGETMTDAAFGHGGFTGTAMWIDPGLDLFVIFLSNRVHPDGSGSVNPLAGRIGALAADAVQAGEYLADSDTDRSFAARCGIDVLVDENFEALAGRRIGLITNHTGMSRENIAGRVLLHRAENVDLVALLSPEHGITGRLDQARIADTTDPETGLKVFSLYDQERKPSAESLEGIDTLVFDIQDIGCRFYTYISTMGEAMAVAAERGLRFVVLDRPNPINGIDIGGPLLDAGSESFVGYHTIPVRHGMTVGEIAGMLKEERGWDLDLQVIRCRDWDRREYYEATGLHWVSPSPNMRNLNQAILYPGVGLLEYTNLSVGRGTDTPFEIIGAPWLDADTVSRRLNRMNLPGVVFVPTRFEPDSSKFVGEECGGVQILITDRSRLDPIRLGMALAVILRKHHRNDWEMERYNRLLSSENVFKAIEQGRDVDEIMEIIRPDVESFEARRRPFLLYPEPDA